MRRVLLLALLAVSGCAIFDALTGDSSREVLRRNRARWTSLAIHDYSFDYQVGCFCPEEATEPVRIEVRGDVVSSVRSRRTGQVVNSQQFVRWPTIDSLFTWTDRAFEQKYRLDIRYDSRRWFPSHVRGDIPDAVDDEFTRSAENFAQP